MSPIAISGIVFAVVFGGALMGTILRALLPEHHLGQDSRDVVKLGMGLIGTIAALVLGLLIASAKSSFDAQKNGLAQMSANVGLLDRILAHYGPEAKEAREQLRAGVAAMLDQTWSATDTGSGLQTAPGRLEGVYEIIQGLAPKNEA